MKPKHISPILRASFLIPTATCSSRSLAQIVAGATALGSYALAGDNLWNGSVDNNWNGTSNWDLGRVPVGAVESDNAIINTLTNFPVITADLDATPNDIKLGLNAGNTGQVDHRSGFVSAGSGSWTVIGENGGTGTYNLADTSASGGTLTGFGEGEGNLSTERLYAARDGGATGTLAVNTSGTVTVFNDMYVGENGTGVVNWDAGTLNRTGGWMVVGRGASGNGTFNINGGTFNCSNDSIVGLSTGSIGNLNQTGGIYNAGGVQIGREGGNGGWTVSGATTELNSTGEMYVGWQSGSDGTLQVDSGAVEVSNWVNVGRDGGTGALNMTGGSLTVERELRIGFGAGGIGDMDVSGGAQITAGTVSEHIVIGGDGGDGLATVSGAGTSVAAVNEVRVGNNDGSVGELVVSGGSVSSGSWFGVGRDGSEGILTIEGTGVVNQGITAPNTRLELTSNNKPSTATVNLDGGTLVTNGFDNNGGGTCNVFLNGGLLKPRIDNDFFLEDMTSVTVEAGGANIDTDGFSISINQSMVGPAIDGGLTKSGDGTLRLNGNNSYSGATTVTAGTLGGSGSVAGTLVVQAGTTLAPGAAIGTFSAGSTTIAGSYACGIDGPNNDSLDVTGVLDLTSPTDSLDIAVPGAGATLPVYVIASYTTLNGTFNTENGVPPGYSVNYAYNSGTQIAITRPLTAYENWLQANFPGETDPAIIGKEADPDGDGQQNNLEFALGGDPADSADNARIYHLTDDSSDAGTARELLLTVAVLNGTPVFAGTPSPTATQSGMTYHIQGSGDLATFTSPVSVVDPVTTDLPGAPAGYEYRTFSLDGSDGLPSKGFMRVEITP